MDEKVVIHDNEMVVISKVASVELFGELRDPVSGIHKVEDAHSIISFGNEGKKMSREIGEKVWAALKGEK